jgi:hypothetical protein
MSETFIDEKRAAMRFLERADFPALRAVRLFDAEEFGLHPFGRDGGGIDDDERSGRARRHRMQGPGAKLLAAPEGPTIRMRLLVGATFSMVLTQLVDGRRFSDERACDRVSCLQLLDFAFQARGFERAIGDQQQAIALNGFSMKS